jgi:hypothetical protein
MKREPEVDGVLAGRGCGGEGLLANGLRFDQRKCAMR